MAVPLSRASMPRVLRRNALPTCRCSTARQLHATTSFREAAVASTETVVAPQPEVETNHVRMLDRLSTSLQKQTRSRPNAHKLDRLRSKGFWADRLSVPPAEESHASKLATPPEVPSTKTIEDSYVQADLPFESDPALLEKYIGAFTSVRVGRLMEDFDTLAGTVAYRHVLPEGATSLDASRSGLYVVTASVDRLDMLRPLSQTDPEDLRLSGHVYSTGNSTMEIAVRLQSVSRSRGLDVNPETILLGRFTMACRDAKTGKAKRVPQLVSTDDNAARLEQLGDEQREKKKAVLKQSLATTPPSKEESAMLHSVFTKMGDYHKADAIVPKEVVWMRRGTQISSVLMCHPQERNVHGNIFGGYLMRLAYEAAYATGCQFARAPITFLALDELSFKAPVTVGSLLQLTSAVTFSPIQDYSSHRSFQVSVEAATIKIHSGEKKVTNTFHYTFSSSEPLQRFVLPENYADGLGWLESMRRREIGAALRKLYST